MSRTNIDLDDAAVAEVMDRYQQPTKRDAVNFALRRLCAPKLTPDEILSIEGIGWDGDLDQMRGDFEPWDR
jgi:Arc/MetJ family transcription regulator